MAASYVGLVLRVLAYIHDHPAGDLSLDALAEVAAMSRFHWHRVFRAITGETCAQATRRIRLHRAACWLVQSDRPVARIATDIGYPNLKSFARAFSEAYGSSPAEFRKAGQIMPAHPSFRTGEYPMHPVTTRTEPSRRVVALPHNGAYAEIGRSFEAFGALCESRELWPQVGPMIGLYLDSPEDKLRSFAGAQICGSDTPDGMEHLNIPGGKTAVLTYKGPYSGIHAAYETLFGNWLPESGEEPGDQPCYEIFLNDPR
ncbi:GyrI-like domain-containing protein [uncultured Ruegeria sp.]|uniref:AraC family transcriptional regulator n=1 Tax=uncultured Ruegeria sp. TaxID=259304 RepID=UPI00260D09AF|nr:AraC family transcriptional regulator [uncultured Ruegeria sp.]